jgi:sugar (pentulose or hexulose) kinase
MTHTRALLVGVDVGTSRTKAGIVDLDGRELARASVPTQWRTRETGGDTSGAALSAGVRAAITAALAQGPPGEVIAVGVTSFAETVIVLDEHGEEVAPAIGWYDTRAADDHRALAEAFGAHRRTGLANDAIPSLAMLHWLSAHDPSAMRRVRHVLSISEWIVRDLGGATAAEPSLASRTAALAIAARAWWPEAISWAGVSPDAFAPLRQAGDSWGAIRDRIDGLDAVAGATLTAAGHDHLVAAVGSGLTSTGQVMDSCGTAEALLRPVPAEPDIDLVAVVQRGVNCGWHVLPGLYNLIVGLRLGLELAPLLTRLGTTSRGGQTPLDAEALAWLLAGDGTPDDAVRAWAQAIRGSVDSASHALGELRDLGGPIDEVLIGGGWAANPVLQSLKQAAFPHPAYPQVAEPGVRGAALLAGQAAGAFAGADDFPAPPLQRIPDARASTKEIPVT